MQLAIGMERLMTPLGGVSSAGTPDINRNLAETRIRFLDKDDHVTFTSHQQLVAGGRTGAIEGYRTLGEALFELGVVTRGERVAAAVVLERAGRFYGYELKGRDLEQGFRAPLRRLHLEEDERARVIELQAIDRFDRVRALVDGGWRRRFRA